MAQDKPESDKRSFDPSEHTAPEVISELEKADREEAARIASEEAADKHRKTVLAAAVDLGAAAPEGMRFDSTGREMNPWEVAPKAK